MRRIPESVPLSRYELTMIQAVTVRTTRKKKQMAYLVLEDLIGSLEVVVFPEQYEKYKSF